MISAALLFARVTGFLKRIPAWAYVAVALLAVWAIDRTTYGSRRYEAGRESVLSELREAEAEAAKESLKRVIEGNKAGAIRAEKEAEIIAEQIEAIEKAEATGGNSLDALF